MPCRRRMEGVRPGGVPLAELPAAWSGNRVPQFGHMGQGVVACRIGARFLGSGSADGSHTNPRAHTTLHAPRGGGRGAGLNGSPFIS